MKKPSKVNAICSKHECDASQCTEAGLHEEDKAMKTEDVKKKILREFNDKYAVLIGFFDRIGNQKYGVLKAFLSTALDRMEKAARGKVIDIMKKTGVKKEITEEFEKYYEEFEKYYKVVDDIEDGKYFYRKTKEGDVLMNSFINDITQRVNQYVDEVIGEDDLIDRDYPATIEADISKNQLRAEQRKRAGIEKGNE